MKKFDDCVDIEKMINEVKCVMETEQNVRIYKRYSVIFNYLQEVSNKAIDEKELLEAHSTGNYIKKYHEGGLDALEIKYSPGAPRKMTSEQESKFVDIITDNIPEEVCFDSR